MSRASRERRRLGAGIDREDLQLVANKAVSFRLYSSLIRTEDKLGEVVEFDAAIPTCICMRRYRP